MRWRRVVREHGPLAAVLIAAGALAVLELRPGHDWGDDFALYIDQARALVEGDVQEVIDRTTYTVQNSSWRSFSPYGYPWVVPLLLAPAYALFGLDYDAFKVVELGFFLGFLVVLYMLLRPRVGRFATLAIVAFVGLNQAYVGWVNSVLSEFPFAFFVTASLLAIERVFAASRFGPDPPRQPPWWALAGVGVLLGVCANVRTEGVIVVLALAARQALTAYELRDHVRRLVVPFAVPYVAGGLFHLLLNALLPSDPGTAIDDSGGMGSTTGT
jgi:4-amino-4-deoxy-L-arabinose transferase-like glycosyltransferase